MNRKPHLVVRSAHTITAQVLEAARLAGPHIAKLADLRIIQRRNGERGTILRIDEVARLRVIDDPDFVRLEHPNGLPRRRRTGVLGDHVLHHTGIVARYRFELRAPTGMSSPAG